MANQASQKPLSVVSVGLVDNDPLTLVALSALLRRGLPEIKIVLAVHDPYEVVRVCQTADSRRIPDILLVDMSMSRLDGIALTRLVRERNTRMIIIAMTSFNLDEYSAAAAQAGAQAIVSKGNPAHLLSLLSRAAHSIRVSHAQHAPVAFPEDSDAQYETPAKGGGAVKLSDTSLFISPREAFLRLSKQKPQGIERLNEVERKIADLCSLGLTSVEIGQRLGMSATTVSTHIRRASEKLGAQNRVQFVALWVQRSHPRR
jgi:two-component system response regulator DevR